MYPLIGLHSQQAWDPRGQNARGQMLSTFGSQPLDRQWGGAGGKVRATLKYDFTAKAENRGVVVTRI